jgi:hypothetical protein
VAVSSSHQGIQGPCITLEGGEKFVKIGHFGYHGIMEFPVCGIPNLELNHWTYCVRNQDVVKTMQVDKSEYQHLLGLYSWVMTLDKDCAFTWVYNTINKSVMESYMTKKTVTYGLEGEEMNY